MGDHTIPTKVTRRRPRVFLLLIGLLAAVSLYDHFGHPVRIYDGTTGKPLAGVFVVKKWLGSAPVSVQWQAGCYKLLVTQTDEQGRYRLPNWSWDWAGATLFDTGFALLHYKPGYYVAAQDLSKDSGDIAMWPETRPANERLWAIGRDQDMAECGSSRDRRALLIPVYEAMAGEASRIAATPLDRSAARGIRYRLDLIRFGHPRADEIIASERQKDGDIQ